MGRRRIIVANEFSWERGTLAICPESLRKSADGYYRNYKPWSLAGLRRRFYLSWLVWTGAVAVVRFGRSP